MYELDDDGNSKGGWSDPDLEKAVTYTLTEHHDFNPEKISRFARKVADNSTRLDSPELRRFITTKTLYELRDANIRHAIGFSMSVNHDNDPVTDTDLSKIHLLLKANQNLAIMDCLPQADLLSEQFYIDVLRSPLTNELRRTKLLSQTKELFLLEKVPFPNILSTRLTLSDILKIRESRDGVAFRKWLHEHIDSMEDVKSAYVEFLKRDLPFIYRLVSVLAQPILCAVIPFTHIPGLVIDSAIGSVIEFKIRSYAERYLNPNPPKFVMEAIK